MRNFLNRSTPPGVDARRELHQIILWLSLAGGFSLGTLVNYLNARAELFETRAGQRCLIDGAVIEDFTRMTGAYFQGFTLVTLAILGLIAFHYSYYRRESMSIYLMKRLPACGERHRRALTLPLLAVAATVVLAALLLTVYFAVYLLATPKICLPDEVWQQLWRLF
jgi:hypothetical protein